MPCATDQLCREDSDCLSDLCAFGRCAVPTCDDGRVNQGESDVACGGPCASCDTGELCGDNTDCASCTCRDGVCVDHAPDGTQCNPMLQNVCNEGECADTLARCVCTEGTPTVEPFCTYYEAGVAESARSCGCSGNSLTWWWTNDPEAGWQSVLCGTCFETEGGTRSACMAL